VGRALAIAEEPDPETEQQVVTGRRSVLPEEPRDRRPVMVGDPDGEAFVDPEACVQLPGSKNRRQRDQGDEERRDRDPVRQHDPPRACELDAGHAAKLAARLELLSS
jgi:hypothetical protein